ncbi:hypothetical protein NQ318_007822 [Aromia moschata]|uniref:Uncharacterized protein n=1 Tax=Aromia moschata TaxID=1265417 RepID=A0AAV8YZI3_9CUCU|nr:hypothetical protein NQ318_007822 [Aromia moschata]
MIVDRTIGVVEGPDHGERSSLYRAMQQQAFYFISRKYVHDVQQNGNIYAAKVFVLRMTSVSQV